MTQPMPRPQGPAERVRLPAFLLIAHGVLAGLSSAAQGLLTFAAVLGFAIIDYDHLVPDPEMAASLSMAMDALNAFGAITGLGMTGLQFLAAAFITWGGVRMMALRDRSVAILAALGAVVPGLSSCCLAPVGLIAGIWSLVLLFDEEIAEAFELHDHAHDPHPPHP